MTLDTEPDAGTGTEATKPIRADARRNRERVLDAARVCFARAGTEAQIDEVAAVAGVGVGTVYRHFETKEALLAALAAEYFAAETTLAEAALQIEDPWQAFATLIRGGAEAMAENRAICQISADRPEVMRAAALGADTEYGFFRNVQTLIDRAKEAGGLRADFELEDIPTVMCSLGALQISQGAYANWRRLLEIMLDGLRAPGASELPPLTERLPRAQ
jgi:AcrR family transcriptional regulator